MKSPKTTKEELIEILPILYPLFQKRIRLTNFSSYANGDFEMFFASILFQAVMCVTNKTFNVLCDYLPKENITEIAPGLGCYEIRFSRYSIFINTTKRKSYQNEVFLFLDNEIKLKHFEAFLDKTLITCGNHIWQYDNISIRWINSSLHINEIGLYEPVNEDHYIILYSPLPNY